MEITFTVDREDYWHLTRYVYFNVPKFRQQILGLVMATPILSIALMWVVLKSVGLAVVVGLPVGAVALAYTYWRMKQRVMSYPSGKPGLIGEHTITLLPDGIRERTEVNDGISKWAGIDKIAEDKGHIYFLIDSCMAHIIPKRAFSSVEESQAFIDLAQKHRNEALGH